MDNADPGRLIGYGAWALGCLVSWGWVFIKAWQANRTYHDIRSRREMWSDFALLLVAASSAASLVLVVLFGSQQGGGIRVFMLALALGGFLAAGIVTAMFSGHGKRGRK